MSGRAASLELISIGNELLLGETVDTNAPWIAQTLAAEGIRVVRKTTVGDDVVQIRDALGAALQRSRAVLCTGGLGPTRDDLTRLAVADLYDRPIRIDETWLEVLRQRYALRGVAMPAINRVQGELPEGAMLLPNERGTAPGIAIEDEARGLTVLLPGVPGEMRALMADHVIPLLRQRMAPSGRIESRVLRTAGLSEAALAELIDDVAAALEPLTLAFLPQTAGVDLRLTAWAMPVQSAAPLLDAATARLRDRLGDHVYAEGDTDLAAVVGSMLSERGLSVSLAESCTGGLIAKRLSDAPGASNYLNAAFVTYANEAKRELLGVSGETLKAHGAVSEQCAKEMALGARHTGRADVGVSVTGVAGPGGGTDAKPVGTVWIAAALDQRTTTRLLRLPGDRTEIRQRAAQAALDHLRRRLLEDQNRAGDP